MVYLPISQTLFAKLADKNILDLNVTKNKGLQNGLVRDLNDVDYLRLLFSSLSWSHFIELIRIKDELQRSFYEIECVKNNWSVRELIRQKNSMLFERLGLSKDKAKVIKMSQKGAEITSPEDLIKSPYIFEFLGIKEQAAYSESDLESALISHLQEFLFEMGKGFCFIARQYRISFNNDHYYVDLLLYNRIIKSLVLIDLKIRDFKPEDAGQMNFYLNYCKEHEMLQGENEPIAIILCAGKDDVMVEYAFGSFENKIYTAEYRLVLPSPEELKREMTNYKDHLLHSFQQDRHRSHDMEEVEASIDLYQNILVHFKGITKKRCAKLLDYFRQHNEIRMPEYLEMNQISERTGHRDFEKFQRKGVVKFVGAKKNGHYELTEHYYEVFSKLKGK
ncbi:hypothetical protein UABAM_06324 [Candidatus Uabimicrobium amorphum]|uniref:DUF1016 family protein n=1 Tax=Uabimicrobium amorphum TaxID=2596890 RepID=A0A5S9F7N2_UABAM|nr:hypothetical protein UABAM_06324 [Candidatus Uabimicrobium amorphum]